MSRRGIKKAWLSDKINGQRDDVESIAEARSNLCAGTINRWMPRSVGPPACVGLAVRRAKLPVADSKRGGGLTTVHLIPDLATGGARWDRVLDQRANRTQRAGKL